MTLLALCGFAFLAGLVDSVVGGGGLIQLPALLVLVPDAPVATLLGTNKVASAAGTAVAVARYTGRVTIPWRTVLPAAAGASVASLAGARVVSWLPGAAVRPAILVLLVAVAVYTFRRDDLGLVHAPALRPAHERRVAFAIGLALGFYDGFFGPGMGSFLIFAFVGVLGFDFLVATASAKVVNLGSNSAAAILFGATGQVLVKYALPMAACTIAGSLVGTRLAMRHGARFIRPLFLVVVTAIICKLAWDTLAGR